MIGVKKLFNKQRLMTIIGAGVGAIGFSGFVALWLGMIASPIPGWNRSPAANPPVTNATGDPSKKMAGPRETRSENQTYKVGQNSQPSSSSSTLIRRLRDVLDLQTTLASQSTKPNGSQKQKLIELQNTISEMNTEALANADIQALATFVLSGGDPTVVENITNRVNLSTQNKNLLLGSVSYVRGNLTQASKLLLNIDVNTLTASLAARLSMAQAQLLPAKSRDERRKKFAFAADKLPGTLLEEAAIRRMVAFNAETMSGAEFLYWTGRYIRRFPDSLYFNDFMRTFVSGMARFETVKRPLNRQALNLIIDKLKPVVKLDMGREIAILALGGGQSELCNNIIERVLPSAAPNSERANQFELYRLACSVVVDGKSVLTQLNNLNLEKLTAEDRLILANVQELANSIYLDNPADIVVENEPFRAPRGSKVTADLAASVAQHLQATDQVMNWAKQ